MADLVSAFMLLTRLPVAGFAGPPDLARCVWAFPAVGLVVNGIAALLCWLAHRAGMTPLLAAAWTLAGMALLTGALHEDGLADTADGFGGGATPERKLAIMRDSRIGAYGVLALALSTMVRVAALTALAEPSHVAAALVAAGMLGRSGMLVIILLLAPARSDGMGGAMGQPRVKSIALGLGLAVAGALLCLPLRAALLAIVLGFGTAFGMARLAGSQIGGFTGDVLGASEVLIECVVLTAAASVSGGSI